MIRISTVFLISVLVWAGLAFGQPLPTDTLTNGLAQIDTIGNGQPLQCYPYCRPFEGLRVWQLPHGFQGVVDITANPVDSLSMQIWSDCDSIHLDTCFWPDPPFRLFFQSGANAQVAICGDSATSIAISALPDTSAHNLIPTAFILMDTLCGITSVREGANFTESYWDITDICRPFGPIPSTELQPNRRYVLRRNRR